MYTQLEVTAAPAPVLAYKRLPKQRINQHRRTLKTSIRPLKTFHPSQRIRINRPILTPYGQFLNTFQNTTDLANRPLISNLLYLGLTDAEKTLLKSNLETASVRHAENNSLEQLYIFHIIDQLTNRAIKSIIQIEAEKGKNGGAANKRRARAIKQFKTIKSDFTLLLNASRSSIGSTMTTRRSIQDQMEDQTKYIETKKSLIVYESRSHFEDLDSLKSILNSDIQYSYRVYKAMKAALPTFNRIVDMFNTTMGQN